jgi:BirA family biotin operon repressor/biotin-[acetyl-CoA-carboxylase] ligase
VTDSSSPRPPLDRDRLSAASTGSYAVEVLDSAPSTNAVVADRARQDEPGGLVVVAEHQTAGRGRLDRVWETPARSSVTVSVLLRPDAEPDRWPWLPLLTGLAVRDALPGAAGLKWPNDVLLGELKVAGILVERVDTPSGPAAVLGVGINVSTTPDELPVPTATSLAIEGYDVDRTDLLLAFLTQLERHVAAWSAGRIADAGLRAAYVEGCSTLGRDVRAELPSGETVTGRAIDIDEGGRLVVETADGNTAIGAGDVIHVRPAG